MNINELDAYNLADAVKFNDELNPRIWQKNRMRPRVRRALLAIADDFREFLGLKDLDIKDITVSGSNAAYTYTPHSDIDLHLVVNMPEDSDEVYRELFDAKKYQYNDQHNIRIGGYDVELYVEDAKTAPKSAGIYSVMNDDWVKIPMKHRADVDDVSVRNKFQDVGRRIEAAIASGDRRKLDAMARKVKNMRQTGLEQHGEFGAENLAYKILRTQGLIKKLYDARNQARDQELSITERLKKKPRFRYGFREDNTGMAQGSTDGDAGAQSTWDGVSPDTQQFTSEAQQQTPNDQATLKHFIKWAIKELGIQDRPRIILHRNPAWAKQNATFGRYVPEEHTLHVAIANRHVMDNLRTLAHELAHCRQHEIESMPDTAGDTGSDWENEAHAAAGILMRRYGRAHPDRFVDTLDENGDETGEGEKWPGEPLPFPKGTVKVGVSDVYDWYKLGQDISDLDDAHPQDYGKGPPEAVLSFGSEDIEHKYIQQLKRLGMDTKDIDESASGYIPTKKQARDPRFKTALTVDVRPGEVGRQANKLGLKTDRQGRPALLIKNLQNALREFKETGEFMSEDQDLFEVKMSPSELQKWAESDEAQGIQAGFEAELIFRDTARDSSDDEDYVPDYDQDERAYSIRQVVEFFQGGDNGISPREARSLETALQEEFWEWQSEAINDAWEDDAEQLVRDYMEENVWENEQDQYRERAAEDLGIETSEESAEQSEQIEARARELFNEDVEREINEQGGYWDEASENFADMAREDGPYDEEAFFQDNYRYMTDIENAHALHWPYYTGSNEPSGGGREPQGIADSLRSTLNLAGIDNTGVVAGGGYHSTARKPGRWIIEPDGSLDPDDYEDAGLEVVSPPMPLPEAMKALRTVIDWANSSEGDAYTNSSTGLHMGVSIPHKGGAVDYVKLVLFMGDQHVLDQFDRAANTYCASALEKLRQTQIARRRGLREQDVQGWDRPASQMTGAEKTAAAMDLMRKNLVELAQRYVQDGVGQSKYTSAHIKDGYIEFRSPGGDYLSMDSRDEQALGNTMLRFARAMYLAGRPDLERKEYSKKLYKLLSGFRSAETARDTKRDTKYRTRIETEGANDALELFAKYSSGMINSEELKKQWAEQVLAKEAPPQRSQDDAREYEVVRRDTGEVIDTIRDWSLKSANETALVKYSGQGFDWLVREKTDAEPEKKLSRRAQVAKRIKERPSIWRVTDTNTGKKIIVSASDTRSAKFQAADSGGEHWKILRANDPDSMLVEPASAAEVKQYQEKMANQQQDSAQVQQRVQGPQDGRFSMYRVRWTERRGGQDVNDSLRVSAANADSAMASVRGALQAQGREITSINAVVADSTEDRAQQRAAQAEQPRQSIYTGQWSGRWQVKDRQGNIVYAFSGVGNSQSDANRTAHTWLLAQGDRLDNQGPFDVVPEMM